MNLHNFPNFNYEIDEWNSDLKNNLYFNAVTSTQHIYYGAEKWQDEDKTIICITIIDTGFDYNFEKIVTPISSPYFDDCNKMKSLLTFYIPLIPEKPSQSIVEKCLNYLISADVLDNYSDTCKCRADFLQDDYDRLLRIILIAEENGTKYFDTTIKKFNKIK